MATPSRWKKRPKGTDASQYTPQSWSNRQRAWEFLRRSERYQRSYDVASGKRSTAAAQPLEAWDFGISEFVDYVRDWGRAEKAFKFRLYGANYLEPEEWPEIENDGRDRVAYFRVNLNLALYDRRLLKFQLNNVTKHSFRLFNEFREELELPITAKWHIKNTPQQNAAWTRYLRLLDLMAQRGITNRQIEGALYRKEGEEPLTSKELNDKLSEDRKQALEMAHAGYIKFAIADRLARKRVAKKS